MTPLLVVEFEGFNRWFSFPYMSGLDLQHQLLKVSWKDVAVAALRPFAEREPWEARWREWCGNLEKLDYFSSDVLG